MQRIVAATVIATCASAVRLATASTNEAATFVDLNESATEAATNGAAIGAAINEASTADANNGAAIEADEAATEEALFWDDLAHGLAHGSFHVAKHFLG